MLGVFQKALERIQIGNIALSTDWSDIDEKKNKKNKKNKKK